MNLGEKLQIVPVLKYGDLNAGADLDGDSINMKNFHSALFIIQLHTIGGADSHLWVYSGATDGAKSSALEFQYAFGGAAQGTELADIFSTWTSNLSSGSPAAVHLTHGTYDNYLVLVYVNAAKMDLANSEEWLTINFADTDTGSTGNVTVLAVLDPRYSPGSVSAIV